MNEIDMFVIILIKLAGYSANTCIVSKQRTNEFEIWEARAKNNIVVTLQLPVNGDLLEVIKP